MTHNTGKSAISVVWAYRKCILKDKHRILIVTTASKSKTQDFQTEIDEFCGTGIRKLLDKFEVVSWNMLHKWVEEHKRELSEWVYVFDEVQRSKGWTTRMGKSFLKITTATDDWAGFTGTPGDGWINYGAYFQACGKIRTKTQFMHRFCQIQTFKGFPEVVGYYDEDVLKAWWAEISYAPDTSKITQELPRATHKVVYFKKPKGYDKVLKMRQKLCSDGTLSEDYDDFLDNPSATFHYLRQLCWTKDKEQWMADFLEGLGENTIIFYNYTATADAIEAIAKKVLPRDARVWRIDGAHHDVPTKDTIGERDIILAQWQSGSEGLNLQFCRVWVSAELTYSYSIAKQARGRILRKGQERPCFFYYLQTEHTVEEDIMKCLHDKGTFAANVWMCSQRMLKYKQDYKEDNGQTNQKRNPRN